MSEIKLTPEIISEIKKFNRNVDWLKKKEIAPRQWVRSSVIRRMTGCTRAQLDTAARNGYINHKNDKGTTLYDPSSMNENYFKALSMPLKSQPKSSLE